MELHSESETLRPWRLRELPSQDRPREKLLAQGAHTLTEAELLALILGTGNAALGCNAVDLARRMLLQFENLHRLSSAGGGELLKIPGVGKARSAQLQALFELARRLHSQGKAGPPLRRSLDIFERYRGRFWGLKQEQLLVVLLDTRSCHLRDVLISQGALNSTIVHPREVLRPAIQECAAGMILMHNHPSGEPTPSAADIDLTRRVATAAELIGVKLVDHLVFGQSSYTSFLDAGLLHKRLGH
ncbi:MAG: DNA repair protein RadC [Myxococcota bacterium]